MPTTILDTDHIKARSILAGYATNMVDAVAAAIAGERERCAKIAENERYPGDPPGYEGAYNRACVDIAMVIRGHAEPNNAP